MNSPKTDTNDKIRRIRGFLTTEAVLTWYQNEFNALCQKYKMSPRKLLQTAEESPQFHADLFQATSLMDKISILKKQLRRYENE